VLQSAAVCCFVSQCCRPICILSVGYCSVLQCVAVCCSVLQCVAVCCSVLQCVAVCCCPICISSAVCYSVLQCVAVYCSASQYVSQGSRPICILSATSINSSLIAKCKRLCHWCVAVCCLCCRVSPCVTVCSSVLQ